MSESQREYEDTLNAQNKVISHHQADIEQLKKTISDREQEGGKVYDEIQGTRRDVDDRESEIYATSRDIDVVRKSNDQVRREIEYVQQDIFQS